MNRRALTVIYCACLFASIVALSWFDIVAITALVHTGKDSAGQLIFETVSPSGEMKRIYPFTYAAVAISFLGVAYYIYSAEKKWWAVPVAILAARASTIGMINLYEQIFVGLGEIVWRSGVWTTYYGADLPHVLWTILGLLWNLAPIPWWRRSNFGLARICFASYIVVMLVWLVIGYPPVESGSAVAYLLNTVSRFLSQATHVILVGSRPTAMPTSCRNP